MGKYLTQDEMLDKIERLEKSLEQSKAANKRIKAECRYIDYNKLRGRFFSKCTEVDRLRKEVYEAYEYLRECYGHDTRDDFKITKATTHLQRALNGGRRANDEN